MVFQIKYDWKLKNLIEFSEEKTTLFESPVFIASPDEISHRWRVSVGFNPEYPGSYGIYLCLDDGTFQKPVSMIFQYTVFDNENEIVASKTLNVVSTFTRCDDGWGKRDAIDRSKCDIKSVKKIVLDIYLARDESDIIVENATMKQSHNTKIPKADQNSSEPFNHQSTKKLQEDLLELYENESSADVTFKCGVREFKVHKHILSSRSPEFYKSLEDYPIAFEEFDPIAIDAFLKFLYTGSIAVPTNQIQDILDMSKNFNIEDLERICLSEMVKNLSVSTSVKYLISADKYDMAEMKMNILKFIKEHLAEVMQTGEWQSSMKQNVHLMDELFACVALNKGS